VLLWSAGDEFSCDLQRLASSHTDFETPSIVPPGLRALLGLLPGTALRFVPG
jgi:hypothetical protein